MCAHYILSLRPFFSPRAGRGGRRAAPAPAVWCCAAWRACCGRDCDGNVEDICGDCGGTAETEDDCVEGYSIYFENLDQVAGTVDVYYASESPIGGAQFDLSGISMIGASGGEAENQGWTVNVTESIWLGFSMNNTPLPQGTRLLTSLTFTAPGDGTELCFGEVILS